MKRLLMILMIMSAGHLILQAQTSMAKPDLSIPSLVAPGYFGPNAFPVPDMSDGTVSTSIKAELYGEGFLCTMTKSLTDDVTADLFARLTIPLFSDRVNLSVWMPIVEWYRSGPAVNVLRRIHDPDRWITGVDSGDAYVSTDILILDEARRGVGLVLRSCLKSASGNSYAAGRVYDAPGYFFDVSAGKDIYRSADSKTRLRLAMSAGFLCWQTGVGRQNDAVMYGVCTSFDSGKVHARLDYGGYVGWEGYGDCPMTLKARVSWDFGLLSLGAMYQVGFVDWPFHQLRLGVIYSCPASGLRK